MVSATVAATRSIGHRCGRDDRRPALESARIRVRADLSYVDAVDANHVWALGIALGVRDLRRRADIGACRHRRPFR